MPHIQGSWTDHMAPKIQLRVVRLVARQALKFHLLWPVQLKSLARNLDLQFSRRTRLLPLCRNLHFPFRRHQSKTERPGRRLPARRPSQQRIVRATKSFLLCSSSGPGLEIFRALQLLRAASPRTIVHYSCGCSQHSSAPPASSSAALREASPHEEQETQRPREEEPIHDSEASW